MKILSILVTCLYLVISCAVLSCDYEEENMVELDSFDVHYIYENNNIRLFSKAVDSFRLDINKHDRNGFSVAHRAAKEGKIDWLALLKGLDADLDEPDESYTGWPPIAWAISTGQKNTVQLLLHYGVPLVVPQG